MSDSLYAKCPHCHAVFKLTEDKLNTREGLVRCGACRKVFNAKWNLIEATNLKEPDSNESKKKKRKVKKEPILNIDNSLIESENKPIQAAGQPLEVDDDSLSSEPEMDHSDIETIIQEVEKAIVENMGEDDDVLNLQTPFGVEILSDTQQSDPKDSLSESDSESDDDNDPLIKLDDVERRVSRYAEMMNAPKRQASQEKKKALKEETDEDGGSFFTSDENPEKSKRYVELDDIPESDALIDQDSESDLKLSVDSTNLEAESMSAFDFEKLFDKTEESRRKVNIMRDPPDVKPKASFFNIEEDSGYSSIQNSYNSRINIDSVDDMIAHRSNPLMTIMWSFVALGFMILLAMQVKYSLVEKYSQHDGVRSYLTVFCKLSRCEVPLRQDARKFTITHTKIDLHPIQPGALQISVKLVNSAAFSQPYPNLQLTLTDRVGRVVGRRVFSPENYLLSTQSNNLGAGALGSIIFNLAQPHEKAVGFVVDVVGTNS